MKNIYIKLFHQGNNWFSFRTAMPFRISGIDIGIIVIIIFTAWWLGYQWRGVINTNFAAESQAVNDAKSISQGGHSLGIVSYTHYPNGPSYILVPFLSMGLSSEWDTLRFIPLTISSLALGFFMLALFVGEKNIWTKVWIICFGTAFVMQPAFYAWQGALHEDSYALSVTLLIVGLSSSTIFFKAWGLWLLGFFSGWIGYDSIPPQFFAVLTIRLFVYHQENSFKMKKILMASLYDGLFFASGAATAIICHLFQNWHYFGSLGTAVNDLIGSAALRMGMKDEGGFFAAYPGQYSFIGTYNPFLISKAMLESFLHGSISAWGEGVVYHGPYRWSRPAIFLAMALIGSAYLILHFLIKLCKKQITLLRTISILPLIIIGVICSCVVWFFIMPYHAACHLIFLPRHFLIGFAVLGALPVITSSNKLNIASYSRFYDSIKWKLFFLLMPAGFLLAVFFAYRIRM